jgi:hypothetical protein
MKGMNNYDVEHENKFKYIHEENLSFTCCAHSLINHLCMFNNTIPTVRIFVEGNDW